MSESERHLLRLRCRGRTGILIRGSYDALANAGPPPMNIV